MHLLAQLKIQKIFLTASLPIRLEQIFLREVGLPANTKIIRARADQPQISYNRVDYSTMTTRSVVRLAIDVARILERFMEPDQIGMIFCMTIDQAKQLHTDFTHCSSYSERLLFERLDDEARWRQGTRRWIATTTGMIQGIDAPNVGATIFLGLPYGLLNLYQGAGRGGRDGRKSWAVVLNQTNNTVAFDRKFTQSKEDMQCVGEGIEWCAKKSTLCRRFWPSKLLDGIPKVCDDLDSPNRCDICDNNSSLANAIRPIIDDPPTILPQSSQAVTIPLAASSSTGHIDSFAEDEYDAFNLGNDIDVSLEGIPALSQVPTTHPHLSSTQRNDTFMDIDPPVTAPHHLMPPTSNEPSLAVLRDTSYYHSVIQTKAQKAQAISRLATMLEGKCVVCWAKHDMMRYKHQYIWKQCGPGNTPGYIQYMTGWIDMKHRIKFPTRYVYCWKCQLPQEDKYRPTVHPPLDTGTKGNKPCPLEDLVILIVWYIRWTPEWWARALQAFPSLQHNMAEAAFGNWLKTEAMPENFFNGLELALWFFIEKTRSKDIK